MLEMIEFLVFIQATYTIKILQKYEVYKYEKYVSSIFSLLKVTG